MAAAIAFRSRSLISSEDGRLTGLALEAPRAEVRGRAGRRIAFAGGGQHVAEAAQERVERVTLHVGEVAEGVGALPVACRTGLVLVDREPCAKLDLAVEHLQEVLQGDVGGLCSTQVAQSARVDT